MSVKIHGVRSNWYVCENTRRQVEFHHRLHCFWSTLENSSPLPKHGSSVPSGIEDSRSPSDTPNSVGLLWTSDRPVSETSIRKHKGHIMAAARFEPATRASERPLTHALDQMANGNGGNCALQCKALHTIYIFRFNKNYV